MPGDKSEGRPFRRVRRPANACRPMQTIIDNLAPADAGDGGIVRISIAAEVATVLRKFGVDMDGEIRSASRAFAEDGTLLVADLGRLMSLCVTRTNCPHFGLLVGQQDILAFVGMASAMIPQSPTVAEILTKFAHHLHRLDVTTSPMLTQHGDTARLEYAIVQSGVESADQIADGAVATGVNVLRMLCGSEWSPTEVLLPRRLPTDLEPFARFFRAPVRFEAGTAALIFPASCLGQRLETGAVLHRLFADRFESASAVPVNSLAEDVRRVLRTRLPEEECSAKTIATLFSMHRRTLCRLLRREGFVFGTLVNEIRFEVARRLLTQTDMTFTQVARALGFAEISVFTRAFRRWSGQTPTAWRAAHRTD
ncbi:AraC family transcriptional regulator [Methylobacterium sp. P1-11]|uniref:AraC family transcriptional regulator n=1 Tax=Methylobacterium sp. P1-11 TaxID=2024616 RepID=UPI0011EF363C|nr:AraC family transcriptional regulator [Methylobacterium sp. P1-11]KAA0115663.1 AraC family transcriptional regulator [Methylobacterium sp. P1-11]